MSMFREVELRLVAVDSAFNAAVVWSSGRWRETAPDFAKKSMLEGHALDALQAQEMFPDADLTAIPTHILRSWANPHKLINPHDHPPASGSS